MEPLDFPDATAWDDWLATRHADSTEAWLRIAKKHSGLPSISISDALDVALCWGWIDGQRRFLDEMSFLQRYCPRRSTSSWSRINVEKVEALTAARRMRPPGLAEVEAAKADGRWEAAYESQRTAGTPPDLAEALSASPFATAAYERLGRTDRYALALPVLKARTAEARAKQVIRAIAQLEKRQ